MESWADQQLAILRSVYENDWYIWYVQKSGRGETWCAKPNDAPVAVVNTDTPEELIKAIAEYEQSHA